MSDIGTMRVKSGLADMLKGGVIMDVTNAEQAKIAENAGACAVMALERVPSDIRAQGGVARMADPTKIREIQEAVTIPVMAKARIGHFVEAQVLESLEVDYIDESEVLTPADEANHINKWKFTVPFVCGAVNLGEALRRISEGAAMIRTKGEAGTGDVVEAVRHMRTIMGEVRRLQTLDEDELYVAAKQLPAPYELVRWVAENGKLPVVNFSAGGIATPADAALMMQLGAEGVFVGSGIFKSSDPEKRAAAIVKATALYADPAVDTKPAALEGRGGAFYSEAAIELILAITGAEKVARVVNLRNDGLLPFLPDDHVVEVPARFTDGRFVAEPVASVPDDVAALIAAVAGYERLALDAAIHGGRGRVLRAMRSHPLVLQHDRAEKLTDLLLAANARFLPWA